jgi:hypothetical protein
MNFVHPSRLQRIQQDSEGDSRAAGAAARHDERRHDRNHHHQHHQHQYQNQQSNVELATEAAFSQVGRLALPAQDVSILPIHQKKTDNRTFLISSSL